MVPHAPNIFFSAKHDVVMGLLLDTSSFHFHQRGHHRLSLGTKNHPFALRSNAFPCYGTVVAYSPSSNKEQSSTAATNAPQPSSTAAYLDSLSTTSQSTASALNNENNNSQDAAQSQSPSSVPMDTPARQSLPDHLRLHPFPNKGLGVITTIPLSKGTFIGEYQGEIFTQEIHDRRLMN